MNHLIQMITWIHYLCKNGTFSLISVMQSDRNSSEPDTFHKPTTYEPHVEITFARHKYGQLGLFRIRMRSLLQKIQPLEKGQFSNCSYLIASHCRHVISNSKFIFAGKGEIHVVPPSAFLLSILSALFLFVIFPFPLSTYKKGGKFSSPLPLYATLLTGSRSHAQQVRTP